MSLLRPDEQQMVDEAKESPLFAVVRPYCADTREKRDFPHIADRQAAKIVLALVPEVADLVKRFVAAERTLRDGSGRNEGRLNKSPGDVKETGESLKSGATEPRTGDAKSDADS